MATATELFRVAQHMADVGSPRDVIVHIVLEAKRLQAIEAERSEVVHVAASDATGAACTRSLMPRHVVTTDEALVTCDVCRCILVGRDREASAPRSWPEGWPPFAVLRRAYRLLDVMPTPSTRWLENNGHKHDLDRARSIRADWDEALAAEVYGELPPEEVAR